MFDVVEDRPMVFTEFCKNGDLTNDLRTGRFRRNLKPVLQLAMQFCDAMSYAKSRGVVAHRDIKPTNLFIKNGEIRIGDFGISQSAATSLPEGLRVFAGNTLSGIGTPLYMAPELWEDPTLFSEQSDIYALGLTR
jgi:eukaryotic-like serine/threonine-protein kinase